MIRAIITDVDGVIVGKTPGVNFPIPNKAVLEKLHQIRERGIPIILCTAKSFPANLPVMEKAHLDNLHITDGGAVIANPFTNTKMVHTLSKEIIEKIVYFALENDIYIELYTPDKYFIQEDEVNEFTTKHTEILQQEPMIASSLLEIIGKEQIVKIMLILPNADDKPIVMPLFEGLARDISTYWGIHPTMLPAQFGVITAHGVSKRHAAETIIKELEIPFDEVLGIGDSRGDWTFLEQCGYVASIGEDEELRQLVATKEEGHFYLSPDVEKNGIIEALEYYGL